MAEETPSSPAAESSDVRRKAFIRLGVAGAITLLALGGLWWLDRGDKPTPPPKVASKPAPIMTAPTPAPAPPPSPEVARPEPAPVDEPKPTPESPAASADQAAASVTPAASSRQPPPGRPSPARTDAPLREPPPPPSVPALPPAPRSTPQPAPPAHPVITQAPVTGQGYVVRLGIFIQHANAEELVERLKKQGIQAYTETRVQVGPFRNRQEAERARQELKRLGVIGVVSQTAATK